jgi:putative transposon-encoded protein
LSPMEIERSLLRRLSIDDVQHVKKNNIEITRDGRKFVVEVNYEARVHLFGNIDLVARFSNNRVELGGP